MNAEGEMSLPLLVSKIIDIATAHANSLGIGEIPRWRHEPWMGALAYHTGDGEGYPRVDSTYTLTTWVESWTRHFSERIIMIADENGEPLWFLPHGLDGARL